VSNFIQIQFIDLGVLVVIFGPEVQPVAKSVLARPEVRLSTMFSQMHLDQILVDFWTIIFSDT
jgi:hypothetical protein